VQITQVIPITSADHFLPLIHFFTPEGFPSNLSLSMYGCGVTGSAAGWSLAEMR